MKTKLTILKHLLILCGTVATTAVFGQSSYVWTNQYQANIAAGDLNQGTNWTVNGALGANFDAGGVPRPDFQDGVTWGDEMLFDGRTTGSLSLTQNGGSQANGGGSGQAYGLRIHLSANQTNPVTIKSLVAVSGGMRMNYFLADAGSGGLIIGDHSGNCLDLLGGVLNGQVFGFTNNSTVPAQITESVRWRMGGAGAHPHIFQGTGDWIVNNHMRSANSSAILMQIEGPGTVTWAGTNNANANFPDTLGTPVRINGGTLVVKSSDLLTATAGSPNIVNNSVFKYDVTNAPGLVTGAATISGAISGAGTNYMDYGALTLAGASTFTGPLILNGGTLTANRAENPGVNGPLGQNGTITFNGGTLAYGPANFSIAANGGYDYSPRFDTSANQQYSIDVGILNVTLATGLSSSGGTLTTFGSGGSLTLSGASTYTGLTTVGTGKLLFQGTKAGSANITVSNNAALGVTEISGAQITPATLTVGTSGSATLEFNNVTNTTTAPLAVGTVSAGGPITINVNSGLFGSISTIFPLLTWTSGSAPGVTLGTVLGAAGTLSTNGNTIQLTITDVPYIWTGSNNASWDLSSANDWKKNGSVVTYANGGLTLFDDTANSANTYVTINGAIAPSSVSFDNNSLSYTITNGTGQIGGSGGLTKTGTNTVTLAGGLNTYTGVTTVDSGILSVGVITNGGSPSDIGQSSSSAANVVLNGGTLQYTGVGATIDRLFSVGTSGGTLDASGSGALLLTNIAAVGLSGNGPRTLTLAGSETSGDLLAASLVDNPAGATALVKSGTGKWIVTGTNTFTGGTHVIAGGTLQVGNGGGTGALGTGPVVDEGSLFFNRTGSVTVSGVVSGPTGLVDLEGTGTVILSANNSYGGGTTINAGTLQLGTGGGSGSLLTSGGIVDNSLLDINTSGTFTYGSGASGVISGTGNLIVRGGGFIKAIGNNTLSGWVQINANTTFQPVEGQDGAMNTFSVITNNGTLRLVRQDATVTYANNIVGLGKLQIGANNVNVGVITLTGTNNWFDAGVFIGDNTLVLGDGGTSGSGNLIINPTNSVQFVNNFTLAQDNTRTIDFNRGDDFVFSNNIVTNFTTAQVNLGIVQKDGGGMMTLLGTNTYGSGTVINAGTVQVGNGGTRGTIGSGPVTDNGALVWNRSDNVSFGRQITGTGSFVKFAAGTLTLSSTNLAYTGPTTVSNGTLVITGQITNGVVGVAGNVDIEGGTLVPLGVGVAGMMNVGGTFNLGSGTVSVALDRNLISTVTNFMVAGGTVTATTGTLKLLNVGSSLPQVNDKFYIFSAPVAGGGGITIVSPGFTVQNNLATDGSVTVTTVQPKPSITATPSGNTLNLSWPAAWTGGVHLQSQTNTLAKGLGTNWVTIAGSDLLNTYSANINRTNGTVFYRLIAP